MGLAQQKGETVGKRSRLDVARIRAGNVEESGEAADKVRPLFILEVLLVPVIVEFLGGVVCTPGKDEDGFAQMV